MVHPAYWKRGHGTQLVKLGIELSKIDNVAQGVSAAGKGKVLYTKLGYRERRGMKMILRVSRPNISSTIHTSGGLQLVSTLMSLVRMQESPCEKERMLYVHSSKEKSNCHLALSHLPMTCVMRSKY